MRIQSLCVRLAALGAALGLSAADAATKTATFRVSATVQSECTISATDLNFGTVGILANNVDAISTISITCTSGASYTIALDEGTVPGSRIDDRRLRASGSNTLGFQLYRNAARNQVWGETSGTDTMGGTGTGNSETLTVYGRIAPQVTPPEGNYDTQITATVTY